MHSFRSMIRIAAVLAMWLAGVGTHATEYRFVPGGAKGQVTLSAAATYYYTGNHSTYDYWEYSDNWDPQEQPGVQASRGDIVIFDENYSSRNVTNIWNRDRYVREVQFNTTDTWELYHNHYTLHLHNPDSGVASRFTQNNSGTVRLNTDTRLDTDTIFGGEGSGTVTIYGRRVESATQGLRHGIFGPGWLTKEGDYTLRFENYASYEGPTTVNEGTLLFNAQSAKPNPDFDPGDTSTWTWVPVTMSPVTVNAGGTLGGTGMLRALVTVNAGGAFAPGAGGPGGFTIDHDFTLTAGSNTLIELGGLTPGNGSGYHDQATVTGQLGLGGTLDVSAHGGHAPSPGDTYAIFQYGSLDPAANTFDAISSSNPGVRANYRFIADYGSGTNDAVTLSVNALPHYYTRGHATNDWWGLTENWSHGIIPGEDPNEGDVVVFALTDLTSYAVNTHQGNPYTVKELRIEGTSNWRFYNPVRDIGLRNPEAGGSALFTHDGSGTVTLDCDLVMDSDTVFTGTGSETVTINGSPFHASQGPAEGMIGAGGLAKNGDYTLVINTPASYQGETVINAGTLHFNGQSAEWNPGWVEGEPDTYYNPVTMAPVTVNDGGTLGGTGVLRAPVTVNSGGSLAPGASPGVFTVDHELTLAAGSTTFMELGGTSPGNGTGYHDQAIVSGQLSLGGTLDVSLHGSHVPNKGDSYTVFQYGSLDPNANAFDTLSFPSLPGRPANYRFVTDYGSGTEDAVTLSVTALPHYYTRGHATNDWWGLTENWSHGIIPGSNPNEGDVVVFALTGLTTYSVNTHSGNPYTVKEIRFEGTSNWRFYNPHRDIGLRNPHAGESALVTHDGAGTIRLDCDLVMGSDTVFAGTGSGTVTINGSPFHSSLGPAEGVIGAGGLTKNGEYTLVINTPASYQGETVINAGTLLFNGHSAQRNPDWIEGEPDTYYNPVTMATVTVNDGGTLGGAGILRAPVTVRSGGILWPGASAGIFTVDSLTLDPGSTTLMELGGLVAGNGDGFHDQMVVAGLLSLGGTLELSLLGDFEPEVGDQFVLFEYGSLDPTHNAFDSLSIPFAGEFVLNYGTGVNSQVILRAVPEPGAFTLLLLGIGVLITYRRRR